MSEKIPDYVPASLGSVDRMPVTRGGIQHLVSVVDSRLGKNDFEGTFSLGKTHYHLVRDPKEFFYFIHIQDADQERVPATVYTITKKDEQLTIAKDISLPVVSRNTGILEEGVFNESEDLGVGIQKAEDNAEIAKTMMRELTGLPDITAGEIINVIKALRSKDLKPYNRLEGSVGQED